MLARIFAEAIMKMRLLKRGYKIPSHCTIRPTVTIGNHLKSFTVGEGTVICSGTKIRGSGRCSIGDHCVISDDVTIITANHDWNGSRTYPYEPGKHTKKNVTIGNKVWIASRAIILPSVRIGDNAVVGAGAVVTKNVPDNAEVLGNPATVRGYRAT